MRKPTAVLTILVIISAISCVSFAAVSAKTAKAVRGTPVIDAVVDEVWKDAPEIYDFNQSGSQIMQETTDIKPAVRMLWDDRALYVLAEIKDDNVGGTAVPADDLCNNDGIEIYLDQDNAKPVSYEADDICIKVDYAGTYVNVKNAPEGVKYCANTVEGGYLVELTIPWSGGDAYAPVPGKTVGYDVEISDNKLGGNVRATWILWNDTTNKVYLTPSVFGNLELAGAAGAGSGEQSAETQGNAATGDKSGEVLTYLCMAALAAAVIVAIMAVKRLRRQN